VLRSSRVSLIGLGPAAAVEVGPELAGGALALHGGDDAVADDEGADVGALGLLDEFLDEDVDVEAAERLDDGGGGLLGLGEDDADALGALEQFDDEGGAADDADEAVDVFDGVGEAGDGQADALGGEDLHGAQLVARARDGLRAVGAEHAHHLELADDGGAVEGVGGADAGDRRRRSRRACALVETCGWCEVMFM
jgi:hypothetical protein